MSKEDFFGTGEAGSKELYIYSDTYRIQDIDESSPSPRYYGYCKEDGAYFIIREVTVSTGIKQYRFFRATYQSIGQYPAKWANRVNLEYRYWPDTF